MRELERILGEIGELRGQAGSECTSEDHYIKKAWEHCLDRVVGIILKHMNDGWIPVEERLPEESLESVIGWDAYRERCCFVQCRNGRFEISSGEPVKIVAWRPLPEPYQTERGDNHDGE